MSSTTFANGVTLTDDDWFNDLNRLNYVIFADATTLASAQEAFFSAAVSTAVSVTNLTVGGTLSVSAGAVFKALAATDASLSAVAGLAVATQAQMEARTATNLIVSPGRVHYHPGVAKAWVSFDGTATSVTSAAAFGVSSITDIGAGTYLINWTTPFSTDFYAISGNSTLPKIELRSVSAAGALVITSDHSATVADAVHVSVIAFGDFA
jgi:hypothetical protein